MKHELQRQLKEFYIQHRESLFKYALSIVNDSGAAEDIIHSSMETLINYVAVRNKLPEKTRCYLVVCIRNNAIDFLRKHRAIKESSSDVDSIIDSQEVTPEHKELLTSLRVLDEIQRETIIMKEVFGYTLKEISRLQNRNLFTVASTYRRGMRRLQKLLEE